MPSDGEFQASCRPDAARCCIHTSFTFCLECCVIYAPSEWHVCYTYLRGCSYDAAIYTTPGDVYALLWLSARVYLTVIAIYRKLHSPHICLDLRRYHSLQYSLHIRYVAWCCISVAIIAFFRSLIYCLICPLSSTMTSILHNLGW